jgi:hypothetical protein
LARLWSEPEAKALEAHFQNAVTYEDQVIASARTTDLKDGQRIYSLIRASKMIKAAGWRFFPDLGDRTEEMRKTVERARFAVMWST